MSKTIFVLLDGCTYDSAQENLGFLEHLIESNMGSKFRVRGELPSLSKPMYETLLTGLPVCSHLVTNNLIPRMSIKESVFSLCRKNNFSTAAASYYWISELYNSAPFNPAEDRIQLKTSKNIENGIFYFEDNYPDSHVFADGEFLRCNFDPDFLMIHSMNIDEAGHKFGSSSMEYAAVVSKVDSIISTIMPLWMKEGYNIVVTSDHGMNDKRLHGGNDYAQRYVALYVFSDCVKKGDFTKKSISELIIAPLLCRMLGIEKADDMMELSESFSENAED